MQRRQHVLGLRHALSIIALLGACTIAPPSSPLSPPQEFGATFDEDVAAAFDLALLKPALLPNPQVRDGVRGTCQLLGN